RPVSGAGTNRPGVGPFPGYRIPITVAEATAWLERHAAKSHSGEGYFFAVCELGDDRFIGTTWFKEVNTVDGNSELAIYMDKDHIGSGWGTDAQRTLLNFGFGTLGLERIWLTVN